LLIDVEIAMKCGSKPYFNSVFVCVKHAKHAEMVNIHLILKLKLPIGVGGE